MRNRLNRKVRLAGIMLLSIIQSVASQTVMDTTFLPFDQITLRLGNKNQVQFFFKPEWFETISLNSSILRLPFKESLKRLESETDCSIVTLDSVLYIFVPVRPPIEPLSGQKYSDVIIIGNPDEYGKYARATIQGRIMDGTYGKPLPGASLFIDRIKIGAIADGNGNYHIQAPVGDHNVRLSFIGYDENTYKIRLVGNGTFNPELYEKSIKLGEVIVTAERPDKNVSGTQMSYVRLDARSIKELPVSMGVSDIIKSITLMPGVQTVGEFGTGFNVRGGSADQNLILLEDVPLFNSAHLFGLISIVNSDGISDVTLTKSGISAKYGERASSVLDIKFGSENLTRTAVRGGAGLMDSRLYFETPLINKKAALQVSARSSYSNWLLHQIPDIDLMNSSAGFYDLNALLTFNLGPADKINLFGYLSDDRFGFSKTTDYGYDNLLASVRWKHTINNKFFFNLVSGISNYRYKVAESDTARPWNSFIVNSEVNYKNLKWNFSVFPADNHAVEFGVNASHYTIRPGSREPLGIESVIQSVTMQQEKALEYAFYVTDNFSLSGKLSFDIGLRYSVYSYLGPNMIYSFIRNSPRNRGSITDSTFYNNNKIICSYSGPEPRISARYSLSDNKSLKFSYNRIHQYINLVSNTSVMTPSDVWKLSSPYLKPLTCDHIALGFYQNFKNNSIESSVEIYYKRLKNAIDYKNGATILLNPYLETDLVNANGNNYGAELYIRKNSGNLTGWASYTLSRATLRTSSKFEEEQINKNEVFPSSFDRPNNLILNLNYHFSRRWRFGSTFTLSSGRPITLPEYKFIYRDYQLLVFSDRNEYRLPDYHRLDVSVSFDESLRIKKKWKGRWTLSVVNLYGRKNAYSVFYKKEEHMVGYQYRMYDTYKLYIIGRPFPTLTYSFTLVK
jgi:hypothetical protein